MDLQLDTRVVLVVGGTGFIGDAVVTRLRDEGATVIVASRHAEGDGLVLDARDDASVAAGIARILDEHGRIDGLVVTAAPSAQTLDPAKNSDPEQIAEAFDAKALSFLRVALAAIAPMREAGFGRVVGISGQNALITGNITGSVRNAALILIAKNLADELAGSGVTVNAVNPGIVREAPAVEVPAGRPGESSPAQIADLVAFLVSPLASTSGESIAVGHRLRGATTL
ncbi:3-oxoacyl-[acyl-carrier-protein] reductase FabG [Frondihabitans sp. 762G35]|uniref:SDR family NAD(P)-dependent oxidoreductase n=1 Tax=Frondihabitans sp. 762G35 TaxID=1446794 RepID=UPI000D20444D|nr:SDR family oxidoreductase [Frondihabitans sp. 762G35]ARC55540.1 3-oxoacyl-[acyl-carrier-protein] reductase FabG [Frondihabitans sp. 762G35]